MSGDRGNVEVSGEGKDHYVTVKGDTRLYQGLYVKRSTVTVSFDAAVAGDAYFFAADEKGRAVCEYPLDLTDEMKNFSFSVVLDAGTYAFGVRTAQGATLKADNFKLKTSDHTGQTAAPGDVIPELQFEQKIFDSGFTVRPIEYARYTVKTEPAKLAAKTPDDTAADTIAVIPVTTDAVTGQTPAEKAGMPLAGKIAIGAGVAAAAGAIIAAILKKKRK